MSDTVCSVANKLLDLQQCGYCKSAFLPEACPTFANEHFCKFAFMANLKMGITNSTQQDMVDKTAASINANLSGIDVGKISWSDFGVCKVNNYVERDLSPFFDRSTLELLGYSPTPLIGSNFLADDQTIGPYAYKWVPLILDYLVNPVLAAVMAIVILVISLVFSLRQYRVDKKVSDIKNMSYKDVTKDYLIKMAEAGTPVSGY